MRMDLDDLSGEQVRLLPSRLATSSLFSPVIVVQPQIAVAINAVNFAGEQEATAIPTSVASFSLR